MNAKKLFRVLGLMVLMGLAVVPAGAAQSRPGDESNPIAAPFQDPESPGAVVWNTFMGGPGEDLASWDGHSIAVDSSGNTYVLGSSPAGWGIPLRPYAGESDAFVAKLNTSGALVWNTFLGGDDYDSGYGIAIDASGNIFVTGASRTSWGTPVRPFDGWSNVFVARLDSSGALVWNTFLGGPSSSSRAIAVDAGGKVYVVGDSYYSWGTPVDPFAGLYFTDAFAAALDSSGALLWNTFLGGPDYDYGHDIAVEQSGNLYVIGRSEWSWGTPVHPGSYNDTFVARLNGSGARVWHTFLGAYRSTGKSIAVDGSGNPYITGTSHLSWGTPIHPFGGGMDIFVAKLDNGGEITWNTFLGTLNLDGRDITLDASGNIYVAGQSFECRSWDVLVAKLGGSGTLIWSTILGGIDWDIALGIAVDGSNLYVAGNSDSSWGTPLDPFAGGRDVFVARLDPQGVFQDHMCGRPEDGWVLESTETSGQGGWVQPSGVTFQVGDDAADRQYRAILSFDTRWIPDNAVINKVTLDIKRQGISGTNPFFTHGNIKVDIQSPYFGPSVMLEPGDFEAPGATLLAVGTIYRVPTADWWYSTDLSAAAFPYISRTGTTQLRLRYLKDDNDDLGADYLKFYSGNAPSSAKYRDYYPVLTIEYTVP